jgi:hypothetical protein
MGDRVYLRTDEGLRRLPLRAFFDRGRAFPQFAGTRQPVISAFSGGKIEGTSFVKFDAAGRWDELASSTSLVKKEEAYEARKRTLRTRMPSLAVVRAAKRLHDEEHWQPTPAEIDAIVRDLLPPHIRAGALSRSCARCQQ